MAYDPALAERLRTDLADAPTAEMKMFGGLAFLRGGHMVCGVHKGGTMYRVGPDSQAAALNLPGVQPMRMGSRTMGAMVQLSPADSAVDSLRLPVLALALATVRTLPPKVAKPAKGC